MSHIISTGATGAIGSAIVREAVHQKYEVTAIVHRNSARKNNIPLGKNIHVVECNIDEYPSLNIEKADVFMHLACKRQLIAQSPCSTTRE